MTYNFGLFNIVVAPTEQPEVIAPRPPARLPQKKSPLVVHVVVENRQSTTSDGHYEQIRDVGVAGVCMYRFLILG